MSPLLLALVFINVLTSSFSSTNARKQHNVEHFGAKPDGQTDSTNAFLAAWAKACRSRRHTTIYVPQGRFLLRDAVFRGRCKSAIKLEIAGTLVAPSDYRVIGNAGNWLLFKNVRGIKVHGGVIDGRGNSLWSCKSGWKDCPTGAMSLSFVSSKNIVINGLTSRDSQLFHILIKGCRNVKMNGLTISAPGDSWNTEGIHMRASTGVSILNSTIGTGDDCISVGPGSTNVWISNVICGPGHGISIGSLGWGIEEPGVANVTVRSVNFVNTQNGVRIKTWGRPSHGFAWRVHFRHIYMNNVQNPIVIDQNYCPTYDTCPNQDSGVKIKDVTYQDIHGTSATKVAMKFACSKMQPCIKIKLKDINLSYKNEPTYASCANAYGKAFGLVQPRSCLWHLG